jgi:Zn-dependent M28 family amino/carboxypeptidase
MPVARHVHGRRLRVLALGLLALVACQRTPATAATPVPTQDPGAARIQVDVRALADDAMQGRATGTPGFERAADYVVARFRALGLLPAGDSGTFSQRVPLLKATRLAEGARFEVVRADRTITLRFRDHFLPELNYDAADSAVRAPAVFVGQGIFAPELQHDDFAGLDLRGKIAVVLGGAPPRFDNDRRAFYASNDEKLRTLVARGAIGAVLVDTAEDEARTPWAVQAGNWERPGMRLRAADGHGIDTLPQLRVVARVSAAAADLLFDGSGHTAAALAKAAQADQLHGFALPVTLALAARTHSEPLDSRNLVARLPGSGAVLGAQALVYSAHLDHLGIATPVGGDALHQDTSHSDTIFNGALDNALGVSIVLETARQLREAKTPPKRSLLFVVLTAEEQGLLGAQWFASHPPARLVADINLDMPMLLAPTRDVVPIGAAHSSLQGALKQAAGDLGVMLSADPFPEEAVFVRSDQFAFVRAGVPALYLDGGVVPAASSAGKPADVHTLPKLAQREFLRRCYHQPCDDILQPIQYGDAARLARLNARLGLLLGNAATPPQWNPGDFFGARFAPP